MNNPFEAPNSEVVGVISGQKDDLRKVATYQRGIMLCILGTFFIVFGNVTASQVPDMVVMIQAILSILYLLILIAGAVLVVMMSIKVYEQLWVGILLGLLTMVPCIGLLFLLVVNQKATKVLRANGVRVGLLGGNPNDVK